MNTQINITENGTTTLATAGKYCDRNIDVNVNVEGGGEDVIAKLVQGTIEGEYVSDEVTSLRHGAFAYCTNLTYVSLPNCTKFNSFRQFCGCTNMTAINLPKLESITDANQVFADMSNIREISLPSLTKLSGVNGTFIRGTKLQKVSMLLLGGQSIGTNCFRDCHHLNTLILGGDTLNPLTATTAFANTGIYSTIGLRIYVPDDLVDSYKTATNWTAYADKIKPMSELEE